MSDETAPGSVGATDGGRHSAGGSGEPAPLQSKANFLQNWSWASVTEINAGLCQRGRAQRGVNSETHATVAEAWEKQRRSEVTLLETLRFLRSCHKNAPFLFFNGNTFGEIGRALTTALFSDLPFHRRKEASSAAAHFITGVLDEDLMISAVESLSQAADWKPGDRVKTLRGTTRGVILKLLEDGRIVWRPDGSRTELTALPESLCADNSKKR